MRGDDHRVAVEQPGADQAERGQAGVDRKGEAVMVPPRTAVGRASRPRKCSRNATLIRWLSLNRDLNTERPNLSIRGVRS